MKKNGIRLSPAMVNMLTRMADGRSLGRGRPVERTYLALLDRQMVQAGEILPAGLAAIGREVPHV